MKGMYKVCFALCYSYFVQAQNSLEDMPIEIQQKIIGYLSPPAIRICCCVSPSLNGMVNDPSFSKELCFYFGNNDPLLGATLLRTQGAKQVALDYAKDADGYNFSKIPAEDFLKAVRFLITCKNKTIDTQLAFEAITKNRIVAIRLLQAQSHVDLNHKLKSITPLYKAVCEQKLEIMQSLLVDSRIDPNESTGYGHNPLTLAASSNFVKGVQLLVSYNHVNVNWFNQYRRTALHFAAEYGYEDVVNALLNRNDLDLELQDIWGRTAHDLARQNNFPNIVYEINQRKKKMSCKKFSSRKK